jgi:hypothetical protein
LAWPDLVTKNIKIYPLQQSLWEKKNQYAGQVLHPIIFCRTYRNCAGLEFTTFLNLNGIGDGNNKNLTHHVFKYKHTKWSRWCITASLNYKNTMINRITMKTVACLRSKCHLKQNLIPRWPWSFQHTSCISDFRCKTKYTNTNFCRTPRPAYWPLWFSARLVRRISKSLQHITWTSKLLSMIMGW